MMKLFQKTLFPASTHRAARRSPVEKVYGADRIGIVGFHDRGFVIAKPAEPFAPWLLERSQRLQQKVGGCTNLTDGLRRAVEMVRRTPRGILRRIWLLSDGYPNRETSRLAGVVEDARRAWANLNTIGFGDEYDGDLLRRISAATHRGKFVPVRTLRELTDALVIATNGDSGPNRRHHRAETTILAIDLSTTMLDPMEGKTKIAVVEEAVLHLLHYKQQCFS
ncbi:MAG: vWA domain-containing protein [Planctomycetota bacterium]|jgi:Mg-chelatase subunit ChlD